MSSPAIIPFQSFIEIDRLSSTPIYLQIAHQCIQAIQRGMIPKGTQLPGTRVLSSLLLVHRKTIVATYEELEAQGWVFVYPNKGTFVIGESKDSKEKIRYNTPETAYKFPKTTGFTFQQSNLLDLPEAVPTSELHLSDGTIDIRDTFLKEMSKYYTSQLNQNKSWRWTQNHLGGHPFLKKQLSQYLNLSRGLHIDSQHLFIARTHEICSYIASLIILQPRDIVLVGELSYYQRNMIFQSQGALLKTIPVDEKGLNIEAIEAICKQEKVRMVHVSSQHHYPTTAHLSAERRLQLLELSKKYGFIIFEEDLDFDYHYNNHPVLPLASANHDGMVVYLGSIGKSFAPHFHMSFIVAPNHFILELQKHINVIDKKADILMEYTLAEMIKEGDFHRFLKKTLVIYKEKRTLFARLLTQYLGDKIYFTLPTGGFAFWVEWQIPINLWKLKEICLSKKLFVPTYLLYQDKHRTAMRIGFAHLNEKEMHQVFEILALAVEEITNKKTDG